MKKIVPGIGLAVMTIVMIAWLGVGVYFAVQASTWTAHLTGRWFEYSGGINPFPFFAFCLCIGTWILLFFDEDAPQTWRWLFRMISAPFKYLSGHATVAA